MITFQINFNSEEYLLDHYNDWQRGKYFTMYADNDKQISVPNLNEVLFENEAIFVDQAMVRYKYSRL